jgi:F-type H+-transporting ATPase subunit delta
MLSVVATRYAKALVDVVMEPGSNVDPNTVLAQLKSVDELISQSHELRAALLSPAVATARKRAVIQRLTEPLNLDRRVRNFLFVIIDHRRIHDFSSVVDAFEALADERMGLVQADVSSALPLSDDQQRKIQSELSRIAGKQAKVKFSLDRALLGGVMARVGSTVYDGSVRGQLERLRTRLGS